MLAFQTMASKRRRDSTDSEDERWLKKARSWGMQQTYADNYPTSSNLPLRTAPSPPRMVPGLEAMTAQSDDGDSPASYEEDLLMPSSPQNHNIDYAMQMDEDDYDMVVGQPPDSPYIATNFRPAKLNSDLFGRESGISNTGRMPTPIYPTFNNSGMNGVKYPSSGIAGGMNYLGMPYNGTPLMQPPPSRKQGMQMDQDRSRRMPSPISEDEDIPDTPTAFAQSQLSRLSVTSNYASVDHMDADVLSSLPPPTPTTPARGRKRSGALTGSGRFSMGYREDCEKCRQRVPGHYSHFLP